MAEERWGSPARQSYRSPTALAPEAGTSEHGPGLVLNILVSKTELGRFILSETQSAGHWDRLCDRHS